MTQTTKNNKRLLKSFLTRLFKKAEKGEPFNISLNGDKVFMGQDNINSLKGNGYKASSIIEGGGFETKEGGILPLAALLPLIFGGIAAAGGTAGGIATVVNSANQKAKNDLELQEQKRHNNIIETVKGGGETSQAPPREESEAQGNGIYLNPYKGKALKDILNPIVDKIDGIEQDGKKQIKKVIKAVTPFFKIYESKDGSGIFLQPR